MNSPLIILYLAASSYFIDNPKISQSLDTHLAAKANKPAAIAHNEETIEPIFTDIALEEENLDDIIGSEPENPTIQTEQKDIIENTEVDASPETNPPAAEENTILEANNDLVIPEIDSEKLTQKLDSDLDQADIKDEANIFDLDESEFEIEELAVKTDDNEIEINLTPDEPDQEEIISIKKPDTSENIIAIEKPKEIIEEIIIPQKTEGNNIQPEEKIEIVEQIITPEELEKRRIAKIDPKKKHPLSYKNTVNPPIINRRKYDAHNVHLDNLSFYEEYYQMLFSAIKNNNLSALVSITQTIGTSDRIAVKGQTPLIFAINEGNVNVIRKMLALGYSANQRDDYGNAPIHLAIIYQRPDILAELIKAGASVTAPGPSFKRPIQMAFEMGNQHMVDILYKAGAYNNNSHNKLKKFIATN